MKNKKNQSGCKTGMRAFTRGNMKNNYSRFLTSEDNLQNAVMTYLKLQYPKVLAFHIPNEGKRTPFERFKAKYLGMRSGASDVVIMHNKNVLCIELKVKPNKLTKNQQEFLKKVKEAGFIAEVVFDFDSAQKIIDEFIKKK